MRHLRQGLHVLAAAIVLACSKGADLGPGTEAGPPARIAALSGDAQVGTVGEPLPQPVVVWVTDESGRPVPGETIAFSGGAWSPSTATSDDDGTASARLTLGTGAAPAEATAGVHGVPPLTVTATAVAGAPAALRFEQSPANVVAGETLDPPVRVRVEDRYGNLVLSSSATVSLGLDHGTLQGTSAVPAASGVAVFTGLRVAAAGTGFVLTATSPGLGPATSAGFDVAALPVDPARSTLSATPSTVAIGEPSTLRVVARDAANHPIAGARVVLGVVDAEGAVTVTQPGPTNAAGIASGTVQSSTAGARIVTATVNGVELGERVTVTVTGGAPASIAVAPAGAALLTGQRVTLTAMVRDAAGTALDVPVAWSSSRAGVATVGADGVVSAVKPGTTIITAGVGALRATSDVAVSYGPGTISGLPYCTMGDLVERMDVHVPSADVPRPLPVAVHIHGGGWVSGSRTRGVWFVPIRDRLLSEGFLVVSVDYRLAPAQKWPAQLQDVKCAIRHLRANASLYGLDPDRIGVVGSSAGGQLAALLGTTDPVPGIDDVGDFRGVSSRAQAVVALSAITDFTATDELRDDYSRVFPTWPDPASPEMIEASPLTHVSGDDSPFFFVVGDDDTLVLPAQSARMNQRLVGAGVASTLVRIANADHGLSPTSGALDPSMEEVLDRMAGFLRQRLR